jgi:glycosyltransferase involved in cell wall biosynthesis
VYRNHTVGVVVIAYNEEEFVGDVVETVPDYVDRVYVVDDGSTDNTWDVIQSAASRLNAQQADPAVTATGVTLAPRIVPIQMTENGGVGAAKKAAYRRAIQDGIDVVASMDGDGQMDPDDLYRFLDPIVDGHAGFTKGNRLWYRESRVGMPGFRVLGNSILSFLTKLSSGYFGMVDPQNGYTAISREALVDLPLHKMTDRYGFLNDQLATLNVNGVTIADVVHPAHYGDEVSGIDLTGFVPRLSVLLLHRFIHRLKTRYLVFEFHPLVFYYLFGTLAMGAGLGLSVLTLFAAQSAFAGLMGLGLSALVFFTGVFGLTAGMIHDVEQNEGNVVHVADEDLEVATAAPSEPLETTTTPSATTGSSPPTNAGGASVATDGSGDKEPSEHDRSEFESERLGRGRRAPLSHRGADASEQEGTL